MRELQLAVWSFPVRQKTSMALLAFSVFVLGEGSAIIWLGKKMGGVVNVILMILFWDHLFHFPDHFIPFWGHEEDAEAYLSCIWQENPWTSLQLRAQCKQTALPPFDTIYCSNKHADMSWKVFFDVSGSSSFLVTVLQKTNTASNLPGLKYRLGGQLRNGAVPVRAPVRAKNVRCSVVWGGARKLPRYPRARHWMFR